ncbi:hypothetical protein K402DRAFT_453151 [Aulographum hederae CBS 113979]|uniref:INO80 complex subunit F domain-containing protein n=1 Tax=Aulographum hederae CBS 113979 TaxID=1176131 RepID=A0A6G1H4L8_9PEZI|nr:hypothetical protein K402DRAFT_453151 [Aulographum hederae CBS 113979]
MPPPIAPSGFVKGVTANTPLPPSVEKAYYRKCIELKRRINEIEDANDAARLRKIRINRGVLKMRLERAFLLEQLQKRMDLNVDGSDRSESPPPAPQDKPLRSKRSHRQKTPPPGTAGPAVLPSNATPLPHPDLHTSPPAGYTDAGLPGNPYGSAQRTTVPSQRSPDPYTSNGRTLGSVPRGFPASGPGGPPIGSFPPPSHASSPPTGVNGTPSHTPGPPQLLSSSQLRGLGPIAPYGRDSVPSDRHEGPNGAHRGLDGTMDDVPSSASGVEGGASGAEPTGTAHPAVEADVEMREADQGTPRSAGGAGGGFTAVNR